MPFEEVGVTHMVGNRDDDIGPFQYPSERPLRDVKLLFEAITRALLGCLLVKPIELLIGGILPRLQVFEVQEALELVRVRPEVVVCWIALLP